MSENYTPQQIFINARFLTQSITGVQRYAVELVKALDTLLDCGDIDRHRYSFTLLAPPHIRYELGLKHIGLRRVGFGGGHLWEQFILPFYAAGGLLVSLCNTGPLAKRCQTVTIHDAAVFGWPEAYSTLFRRWYQVLLPALGRRTSKILTDSGFSAKELVKYCHINPGKIKVISLGKEQIFSAPPDEAILRNNNLSPGNFAVAVSSMSPHKNFRSIVRAVELLGESSYDVVIAGGVNPKVFSSRQVHLPSRVKYLGYVSDSELRTLYEHAGCFIYPSFYEGFGLPPLEAMACGCPVIVADTASLPEVCGDAAMYCDPHSHQDIADKIRQIMNDGKLREMLRQKGLARAKCFTWDKCARETWAEIKSVLTYREGLDSH